MQRCVITGASRGIGRALALRLAQVDREIVLVGRNEEGLRETQRLVEGKGGGAVVVVGRLESVPGAEDAAKKIAGGRVDVLVNNAGVSNVGPIGELTAAQWEEALMVNVTAPFVLVKAVLPKMAAGSTIVNVLSVANKVTFPNWAAYTMSKAALEGFSRVLREEVRPQGIRVVDAYIAATDTELWEAVPGEWKREGMLRPAEAAEAIAYAIERPNSVLVESISVGSLGGNL